MQTINIGGLWYYILSEEAANERRADAVANPDVIAGIDKLATQLGQKEAENYFSKFLDNLKYLEIKDNPIDKQAHQNPKPFNCPCNFRRKLNKSYICWGVRCPKSGIVFVDKDTPSALSS